MQSEIRPGQPWLDTNGVRIEAHGGSIFYENGLYYWYGEDKSHTRKKGRTWTWGVKCYSSADLYNWKDEGHIIPPRPDDKGSLFYPARRLDRPHILHNKVTGKYVCWLKFCDRAHFAVLTADTLLGPYTLITEVLRPYGRKCGDFDLAMDDATGRGYLYFEADHEQVLAARLNRDFTDVDGEPAVVYSGLRPPLAREGVTHFAHSGKHYLLTSGMTGYVPNPCEVAVADDWMGPFTVLGDPHVDDASSASFNSQPSCAFRVADSGLIVVAADRWVPEYVMTKERYDAMLRAISSRFDKSVKSTFKEKLDLLRSPMMGSADTSIANYVWLPIQFEGDIPRIHWHDQWRVEDFS